MKAKPQALSRWLASAAGIAAFALPPANGAEPAPAPAKLKPEVAKIAVGKLPDVIYVPTPQAVVNRMLEMAGVKTGDVVYDLGCGDGRIVVTAAKKYGVKAVGFDIDPVRVAEAQKNVQAAGVGHLVRIEQADIFTLDLREASVVTLYLLPSLNVRLMPQLAQLKPGSRIVSHNFDMRGAKPVDVQRVEIEPGDSADATYDEDSTHTVFKWIVPWEPMPPEKAK